MISAALSSPQFSDLIEALPDYEHYVSSESAYDHEPQYRLAIGRVLKTCGDRLLDAAEIQRRFLTATQTRAIDALVATISETLHHLNCYGEICIEAENPQEVEALREIDGRMLHHLETLVTLSAHVRRDDMAASWLTKDGSRFYRTLRRLNRVTRERNERLGLTLEDEDAWAGEDAAEALPGDGS